MKTRWQPYFVLFMLVIVTLACAPVAPKPASQSPSTVSAILESSRADVLYKPSAQTESKVSAPVAFGKGDGARTSRAGIGLLKWPDLWIKLYHDGTQMVYDDDTAGDLRIFMALGSALLGLNPSAGERVTVSNGYVEIIFTGTTAMISHDPDSHLTFVRMFEGTATLHSLTGIRETTTVGDGEWALITPGSAIQVSSQLEEMRSYARRIGKWDLFHEIELDVRNGFAVDPAERVPANQVQIVFVATSMPTATRTPTPDAGCRPGVLYCEDFRDGQAQGWRTYDAVGRPSKGWTVVQDRMNHVFEGAGHQWATLDNHSWGDYIA
ncbi:MAG: hypothetical protein R6W76_08900, partial [Caldilinea sp.]